MKKLLVFISILTILLSSCTFSPRQKVRVNLLGEHMWEYIEGRPMWYTLEYFDGSSIRKVTVGSGTRSLVVEVERGKTCLFLAYPLDSLSPQGGVLMPWNEEAKLDFDNGRAVALLMDVARFDPSLIEGFNAERLLSVLDEDFDEDKLYASLLDGSFTGSGISKAKCWKVSMSNLAEGYWLGEFDNGISFTVAVDEEISLELIPGLHRFYNRNRRLVHVLALYSDGKTSYYDYSLPLW